jgi:hypothetical protein
VQQLPLHRRASKHSHKESQITKPFPGVPHLPDVISIVQREETCRIGHGLCVKKIEAFGGLRQLYAGDRRLELHSSLRTFDFLLSTLNQTDSQTLVKSKLATASGDEDPARTLHA